MRNTEKLSMRACLAAVAVLAVGSGHAEDLSIEGAPAGEVGALHGAYGFTVTQSCVRTPFQPPPASGFDPVTKLLLTGGEIVNANGTGVMRFTREGAASIESGVLSELSSAQIAAGQKPVSAGTRFTCSGTYARQPGSKVAVTLSCNVLTPQPGITVTLGPLDFEGYVARTKQSINLASVAGSIHKVSVAAGGNVVQERERICVQSMTLSKI